MVRQLVVNADLIETVEHTADTVTTLLDGKKLVVKTPVQDVVDAADVDSPQTDVRAVGGDVAAQVDVVTGLRGEGTSPIGEVQVCLQIDVVMRLKGHIPVPAQTGIYRADRNLR